MKYKIEDVLFFSTSILAGMLGVIWLCHEACVYWPIDRTTSVWLIVFAVLGALCIGVVAIIGYTEQKNK